MKKSKKESENYEDSINNIKNILKGVRKEPISDSKEESNVNHTVVDNPLKSKNNIQTDLSSFKKDSTKNERDDSLTKNKVSSKVDYSKNKIEDSIVEDKVSSKVDSSKSNMDDSVVEDKVSSKVEDSEPKNTDIVDDLDNVSSTVEDSVNEDNKIDDLEIKMDTKPSDEESSTKPLIIDGKVLDEDSFIYVDKESVEESNGEDFESDDDDSSSIEEIFAKVDEILDDDNSKSSELEDKSKSSKVEDNSKSSELDGKSKSSKVEDSSKSSEPKNTHKITNDLDEKKIKDTPKDKQIDLSKVINNDSKIKKPKSDKKDFKKSFSENKNKDSKSGFDAILNNVDGVFGDGKTSEDKSKDGPSFLTKIKDIFSSSDNGLNLVSIIGIIIGIIAICFGIYMMMGNAVRVIDSVASGENMAISFILVIFGFICIGGSVFKMFSFKTSFNDTINDLKSLDPDGDGEINVAKYKEDKEKYRIGNEKIKEASKSNKFVMDKKDSDIKSKSEDNNTSKGNENFTDSEDDLKGSISVINIDEED